MSLAGWKRQVLEIIEEAKEAQARGHLAEAEANQEELVKARRAISTSYHPDDLETGEARSAEQVKSALDEHFGTIEEVACWAGVSQRGHHLIAKARRVVPLMVATITFFHEKVRSWVGELGLAEGLEGFVFQWIAGRYLELVAGRAQDAQERRRLGDVAAKLMPSAEKIKSMLSVLSLFHHSLHRLMGRKLEALTVVHNSMKVRPDGTMAAERFFGVEPYPFTGVQLF